MLSILDLNVMNMPPKIKTLSSDFLVSHLCSALSSTFTDKPFVDVTLISDDQIPLHAHKFILSACSPVLKTLLLENPHSHPLIYL